LRAYCHEAEKKVFTAEGQIIPVTGAVKIGEAVAADSGATVERGKGD